MTVFVVDVRDSCSLMHEQCKEILNDYFDRFGIKSVWLTENQRNVDSSWLKLRCFDYVDDEFVICWDLDLLPKRTTPSILSTFNTAKINLAIDSIFESSIGSAVKTLPNFRFNCGLIGIPLAYKPLVERVFDEHKTSGATTWEQFPLNAELARNQFADVHEISSTWNQLLYCSGVCKCYQKDVNLIHYAGLTSEQKAAMIALHHKIYFKN